MNFHFFLLSPSIDIENPCTTPDNWNGKCIVLQQCRPLYKTIMRGNLSPQQRNFLRNSQCGRDGANVLVCCPNTFTIKDLPEVCGVQNPANRIFGGIETKRAEYPWYELNLSVESILKFFCFNEWKLLFFFLYNMIICLALFNDYRMALLHYINRKQIWINLFPQCIRRGFELFLYL